MTDTNGTPPAPPLDLSLPAIKVARRIQGLKNNATYVIILTKMADQIYLSIREAEAVEVCR